MCGISEKGRLLFLCFLLTGLCMSTYAQMSDEAVARYALEGKQSGKSDQQIGKELLARGVTADQLSRLREQYDSGSRPVSVDISKSASEAGDRLRSVPSESQDGVSGTAHAETQPSPRVRIFGHDVFTGQSLTFEPNSNLATPENYKLGPGDEVIIDIWGENEDHIRGTISPEGNIMVEQLGPVYLNGLTISAANERLRGLFSRKYAGVSGEAPSSDIRVTLGQLRTIQVNILGEVVTPGTYRLSSFATVFHALYKAGGITDIGTLRNIRVLRGGREIASVDVYKYLFDGDSKDDIRLEEGDIVLVPPYDLLVEVTGRVKRPMRYELEAGEPLSRLLDYAGGFTGDAYGREVRVVRTMGREHELFNVDSVGYGTFALMDGDSVAVGRVLDRYANRIEVQGAVYRPGMYELGEGTRTVRELIGRAEGLREDAFRGRALLLRERDDLTPEIVAVDLEGIFSGRLADIALRRNDVLSVSSVHDLEERGGFTIGGEVARPGVYPYAEHTTVEDLIVQAGGLLDGASLVKVDIARRLKDAKSTAPSKDVGKVYTFSLKDGLVVDGEAGFELAPFDVVEVRRSPGYQPQRRVELEGEVVFSGGYALIRKNERLSDLVKRAGGITDDAYVRGGRLIRRMNEEERAVRDAALRAARQNRGADSVSLEKLQTDDYYTVGIELDKALSNPGSDYDMVLREGDRLIVPEYVSTVKINGDVMYPNTTVYMKDKRVKYYIAQAGGYGARAKRNKAYIVYLNGRVARVKGRAKVEPGCEIIVPSKRERKGMGIAEILGLTTSAASIGTMAASIANMTK